jgi:hypothetical protein
MDPTFEALQRIMDAMQPRLGRDKQPTDDWLRVTAWMSGYSASVKNFAVTVVAGLLAFYSQRPDDRVFLFAALSIGVLLLLDAHYLRLEKAFRAQYDRLRLLPLSTPTDFAIECANADKPRFARVACSWSVSSFYAPLLLGLLALYLVLKVWPL